MNSVIFTWFRRFVMIVVPIALVFLEWNHPSGFSKNVAAGLSHMSHWWTQLHIIQSFLFGIVAVGAFLLTLHDNGVFGTLSKIFILFFAICYLVFDSTAGIGVGFILGMPERDPTLDIETVNKIAQALYTDKIIGGSGSFFSLFGSWSWLLGIGFAIISIALRNRRLSFWKLILPLLLLAVSAYMLYVGHYSPYGPIAFATFALASVWMDFFGFDL
ncbi:MAG TPA: hypothetical protein PLC42_07450 [Parachlamydiaceae bacterium]|nr:hypothetical protein [Parachlamydiaceae bacterium]